MSHIKEIPDQERPREKGMKYGVSVLSNRELLAILIRSGTKEYSALEVADKLLQAGHGMQGIARLNQRELSSLPGISNVKALELQSALELSRRILQEETEQRDVVQDPESLYSWLRTSLGPKPQEEFLVVFLDHQHHIMGSAALFKGTDRSSMASPREVFKAALEANASYVMLVHNHPSGSSEPSEADIRLTKRMIHAGRIVGIQVADHLIVTQSTCTSLRNLGIVTGIDGWNE